MGATSLVSAETSATSPAARPAGATLAAAAANGNAALIRFTIIASCFHLTGAPAPGIDRPWAGTEGREREEPAGDGDVLAEVVRLVSAHVEEERREQAEACERDRRPAGLDANQHENTAAEVSQDDERQEGRGDAVLAHVVAHLGIVRNLVPAIHEEDVDEHRSRQEDERPGEATQEREICVDARHDRQSRRAFGRGDFSARHHGLLVRLWRDAEMAPAPRALGCVAPSDRVGVVERLGEVAIILAVLRAAELLDRRQLLLCEIELALDHIGLAEILAHLRILRIERARLDIIANPLVGSPELAGRVAAVVERAWRVGVVEQIEHVERLLEAVGLSERIGVFGELGVGKHAAVPPQALVLLPVPDLAWIARGQIVCRGLGARRQHPSATSRAYARSASAARAAALVAAHTDAASARRKSVCRERQSEDENSGRKYRSEPPERSTRTQIR